MAERREPLAERFLALVSHGEGHQLSSEPGIPAPSVHDLHHEHVSDRYAILRHGGGGAATSLVCGAVRFDHPAAHHLVTFLPRVIHVEASSSAQMDWMQSTLRFMAAGAKELRPGGETVITRLADILVIQAIPRAASTPRSRASSIGLPHVGSIARESTRGPDNRRGPWSRVRACPRPHLRGILPDVIRKKTVRMKPRRPRISKRRLEKMIEEATVDCYDESEQIAGWFTVIDDNLSTPFETTVLGVAVTVERVELDRSEQIIAVCSRGRSRQSLPILDLPLPTPPPEGAEWIEAYRQWRGEG